MNSTKLPQRIRYNSKVTNRQSRRLQATCWTELWTHKYWSENDRRHSIK